ncbi:MAG: putative enoyl-CoA hydratase 1 [Deltaproteobacteria bacterium]|nr:putative enoyl-CoA hydratase 1 [Deltaproteobacteria bacterium]
MPPTVVPSIGALKSLVGQKLGVSEWVTVTQQQINSFADATGDHQWIHVDVERAKRESPFKQPIAHGYLTISLAPVLLPQVVRVEGVRMAVNYGLESMRLPAPVPSGARVRMSAEMKDVRDMPGGGARVTFGMVFEVEGGAKPACIADAIYVYYP